MFGTDKAFNSYVSCADFNLSDREALAKGGLRLLPYRDDRGRAIVLSFSAYYYSDVESMVRYIVFLEDEEGLFFECLSFILTFNNFIFSLCVWLSSR